MHIGAAIEDAVYHTIELIGESGKASVHTRRLS